MPMSSRTICRPKSRTASSTSLPRKTPRTSKPSSSMSAVSVITSSRSSSATSTRSLRCGAELTERLVLFAAETMRAIVSVMSASHAKRALPTSVGSCPKRLTEKAFDEARIRGLYEMQLAARFLRLTAVVVTAVGADDDDAQRIAMLLAQAARDLEAVEPRQAEVEQHHVGPHASRRVEGGRAGCGDLQPVSLHAEEKAQRLRLV